MLYEELKSKLRDSMKRKHEFEINTLRLLIGEVDRINSKKDEDVYRTINKLVNLNDESLKLRDSQKLRAENQFLSNMLPRKLLPREIRVFLDDNLGSPIRLAKSDGQAIGASIKLFKEKGLSVNGDDVSKIVKEMRNEPSVL